MGLEKVVYDVVFIDPRKCLTLKEARTLLERITDYAERHGFDRNHLGIAIRRMRVGQRQLRDRYVIMQRSAALVMERMTALPYPCSEWFLGFYSYPEIETAYRNSLARRMGRGVMIQSRAQPR